MRMLGKTLGRPQSARTDLGLALLSIARKKNRCFTAADIAAWCDCTNKNILRIEARALKKLRAILRLGTRPLSEELSEVAPKKHRSHRFTGLVLAPTPATEMPLKQWVMEAAEREGVSLSAIYMRIYRHPERMPAIRRVNRRVVMVQLEAA